MANYPKIQRPCPYKGNLSDIIDGEHCRICDRQVTDLTAFTDGERGAFFRNTRSAVCVSYRLPLKTAIAAAMVAAAVAIPTSAAADDGNVDHEQVIVVGAIHDPANVTYVSDPRDAATPNLPVVYDAQSPAPANQTEAAQSAPATAPSAASTSSDLGHSVENQ